MEDKTEVDLKEVRQAVDWIDVSQDRNRWWAFVNVEMNLQFP